MYHFYDKRHFSKLIKFGLLCSFIALLFSCQQKTEADLLIYNAQIYTVDEEFSIAEAMAIKEGEILETNSTEHIKDTYKAKESLDLEGKTVLPGLFDAHAHFLKLGQNMQEVDLVGSQSFEEVLERIADFQEKEQQDFIVGNGWDQNKWPDGKFPTKEKLDSLYPDIPVVLMRIDVHVMLVNQKALDLANIDKKTTVAGGTFVKNNGELTGVLLDNAMDPVFEIIPEPTEDDLADALLRAQEKSLSYGLTNVASAWLSHKEIQAMDKLAGKGGLQIGVYPMLVSTDSHLDDYLQKGLGDNKNIPVKAIKLFGDGALGSRGAALRKPYSDDPDNLGKMRHHPDSIRKIAQKVAQSDLQLNTHGIGDSANHVILNTYAEVLEGQKNRRWRVEHASVVDPEDLKLFSQNIIPSIQPAFVISDMDWLENRLDDRLPNAYASKDLLDQANLVVLGTDAPVEDINPFRTFYAAVTRKKEDGEPSEGFQPEQQLTREETLKGMTIWAAHAEFSEKEKGSLEKGKQADFVILNQNIMEVPENEILKTEAETTFIKGKKVHSKKKKN